AHAHVNELHPGVGLPRRGHSRLDARELVGLASQAKARPADALSQKATNNAFCHDRMPLPPSPRSRAAPVPVLVSCSVCLARLGLPAASPSRVPAEPAVGAEPLVA